MNPDVTITEMLPYFKGAPHVEHFSTQIRGNLRNPDGGKNQTSNRPREKKEGGKGDVCRDVRNELKINN